MNHSVELEAPAPKTPQWSLPLRAATLVPLWAAVAIGLLILIRAIPGRATKWDYSIYYSSALAMREGMNPYIADLTPLARSRGFELGKINHATDPPTFVMCFVPLTLLAPRAGFYVWTAINAFAFLLALVLLVRWTLGLGRDAALAVTALTILFPPVIDHLVWGQNKMLVLLMFVLMLRWMERGRDAAAGLILAFATLLRAFPLLLVGYLILIKRWRAVAYTMVGLAVGGLATVALVGVGSTLSFVVAPGYLTERWREALPSNIALGPSVLRMFWYFFGMPLGATLQWASKATSLVAEVALLAFTVRATIAETFQRRSRRTRVHFVDHDCDPCFAHFMVLLPGATGDSDGKAERRRGERQDQPPRTVGRSRSLRARMALFCRDRPAFAGTRAASEHARLAPRCLTGGTTGLSLALLVRYRSGSSRPGDRTGSGFASGTFATDARAYTVSERAGWIPAEHGTRTRPSLLWHTMLEAAVWAWHSSCEAELCRGTYALRLS